MKKDLEKILKDLVNDYKVQRAAAEAVPAEQRGSLIEGLANTLVLIQTQINNANLWAQNQVMYEELAQKRLLTKDLRENGVDRTDGKNAK